jgi:hypothetical protein
VLPDIRNHQVERNGEHRVTSWDGFSYRVRQEFRHAIVQLLAVIENMDHKLSGWFDIHDLIRRAKWSEPPDLPYKGCAVSLSVTRLCFFEPVLRQCNLRVWTLNKTDTKKLTGCQSASAPEMISISSLVMLAWR